MNRPYYYILVDQEPVPVDDIKEWGSWFSVLENRIIARTESDDGVTVSTIFLGLDHNYGVGPPILYETMVFGGEHHGYCERYYTLEEAMAGHYRATDLVGLLEDLI